MAETKYLHIGCGGNILPPPFVNLDSREISNIDIMSSANFLPFSDESFDLVYASHILEHIQIKDTQNVVTEWVRVLKPGGTIRISVPSLEALIEIYQKSNKIENIQGPLFGGQTYVENFHFRSFDKASLTKILELAGCEAVHPWDFRRTIHSEYWDFSQATTYEIPISLNLEARKIIRQKNFTHVVNFLKNAVNVLESDKESSHIQIKNEILTLLGKIKP
jgi:SAM-dependent methyltransferase